MNPFDEFFQRNFALAKIENAYFTKTSKLTLEGFDLTELPAIFLNSQELRTLLRKLCLARNKIKDLPSNLHHFKNLQSLAIDHNNLDQFPSALKELNYLRSLNIGHNPIKDLTPNIGSLKYLEVLQCNCCCLTSLPEEIGLLQNLCIFGARTNQIAELPNGICNLGRLHWLTLENNKLLSLPENFDKMQELRHVNFNNNNFSDIPSELSNLKKLQYLTLQSNELSSLSCSLLGQLKHVRKIVLNNNPIITAQEVLKNFRNVVMPGIKYETPIKEGGSDTDSSSDYWEGTIDSADLDHEYSDSETDEEESYPVLHKLPKYLFTH